MKKILFALLFAPAVALSQSYPSPTYQNLTVLGTFTASGKVGLASLAAQAANTVVANATGSSASPTAFAMPSCSATGNALNWTTSTGFVCQAGLATLASPTFTGTPAAPTASATTNTTQLATTAMVNSAVTGGSLAGSFTTIAASSTITPSQTAGIVGTTTNNNANAGSVGEFITSSATAVSLTTATNVTVTSISLTAGDWDVRGNIEFTAAASTIMSLVQGGINASSAVVPTSPNRAVINGVTFAGGAIINTTVPPQRVSVASTTTVYLVANLTFTTSTATAAGFISARRVR